MKFVSQQKSQSKSKWRILNSAPKSLSGSDFLVVDLQRRDPFPPLQREGVPCINACKQCLKLPNISGEPDVLIALFCGFVLRCVCMSWSLWCCCLTKGFIKSHLFSVPKMSACNFKTTSNCNHLTSLTSQQELPWECNGHTSDQQL